MELPGCHNPTVSTHGTRGECTHINTVTKMCYGVAAFT